MKLPLHRMKKNEILWLNKNYCKKHGHTYLEHYQCFLTEAPITAQRVGYFDIETTNLDADFGIMLAWAIKEEGKPVIHSDVITLKDIQAAQAGNEDERVVRSCIDAFGRFDKVITWYGKRFDVPFVRTRALICRVPFPDYSTLIHEDAYFIARNRLKLTSNRLENVCRAVLSKTNKTRIERPAWRAAGRGDEKSLKYVLDHNKKDVIDLERVYKKLMNFTSRRDTSI